MVTVSVLLLLFAAFSPPVHNCFYTFHLIPDEMNQTAARTACGENYTDLVTVYSDEENTELVNLVNNRGTGSGWIGLYRGEFSEKWSNGDPVTFRNLAGDCGTSSCCAAMKADGLWKNLQCTETRKFMCYEGDITTKPTYHLISENKTWYEAQRYCRERYTDLISIRDQQQNEEVKIKGLNSNTPFWIGLLCDDWQWTDGGNSAYRNWASGQPRSSSDCVELRNVGWYSVQCSNIHYTLCSNYSIHVSAEALNWEEALGYCQEGNRAGILTISDKDTQEEMQSLLENQRVSDPVWVGLRQSLLFGFWIWVNGDPVFPYSNWDEGKQPEHHLSQHCGAVDPQRGHRWRDMNCLSRYRVLCLIKCSP